MTDLLAYLSGSLLILHRSMDLYRQGDTAFYRVMAVQLRLLLADTARRHDRVFDLALVPRIHPDFALPPLRAGGDFDRAAAPLPLADWLDQRIQPDLTLRELIRAVCDQDGGAHVDRRQSRPLPDDRAAWIARIAALVLEALV